MKKNINFLFDNYEDSFFLPNGINPNLIESYKEQKNIEGLDWETFFDKLYCIEIGESNDFEFSS